MKIRVAIAEDDQQIAEIQKRFIERMGNVELCGIAYDLATAREIIEVFQPELLLLDVQFPEGTGIELLQEIRAKNLATDVILITAAKEVTTLKTALRSGVFDYILKPLVFQRLEESINNYHKHLQQLTCLKEIGQHQVDQLLPRSVSGVAAAETESRLPKGIDSLTLDTVIEVFRQTRTSKSAEEVGEQIGASRTTARRYLEYLVSAKHLTAEVEYGSVGRPERRYRVISTRF
jgi:two-component system, CitB family, response regulator